MQSPSTETWEEYRKYVVEALKGLNERTLKIVDELNAAEMKINNLEQKQPGIKDIETSLAEFEKSLRAMKDSEIAKTSAMKVWLVVGGAIWTLIVLVAQFIIKTWNQV